LINRMKNKEVYAYLRTSNKNTKNALDSDSKDRQLKAVRKFCSSKKWTIKEIFYDCAVSGDNGCDLTEREEFSQMMTLMKSNCVKTFLVSDATRFSRSILTAEIIKQDCREHGISAYDASTGNDLCVYDNPEMDMINSLLQCVAQYDRIKTTNRLMSGRKRKARLGGRMGGQYRYGDRPGEQVLVERVKELKSNPRQHGKLTLQAIANKITVEGFTTRKGTAFSRQQIANILKS
jgi:DNA invertase Pin-like site-specific DNA recombinase